MTLLLTPLLLRLVVHHAAAQERPVVDLSWRLLGATTTACWQNTQALDAAFPNTTINGRAPGNTEEDMCTVTGADQASGSISDSLLLLLEHAQVFLSSSCGVHTAGPCAAIESHLHLQAMHVALHTTLRYHMRNIEGGSWQKITGHIPPAMQLLLLCQLAHAKLPDVCRMLPGLQRLAGSIAAHGNTVDCRWDPTLPETPGRVVSWRWLTVWPGANDTQVQGLVDAANAAALQSPRYLIAFNLRGADHIMPHFVLHLLSLVTWLPRGRVLVSCYESGSSDSTPAWLNFLSKLLHLLGVPNLINTQGEARQPGEGRIQFLARVRNAALLPLWDAQAYQTATSRLSPAMAALYPRSTRQSPGYPADHVFFINDVFFCWQDMIRLLNHKADLACGLDFISLDPPGRRMHRRLLSEAPDGRKEMPGGDENGYVNDEFMTSGQGRGLLHGLQVPSTPSPPAPEPPPPPAVPYYQYYDIWVGRDITGARMVAEEIVKDAFTQTRLHRGLPVPVQCCWNGAAVFSAKIFRPMDGLLPKLRFRAHDRGECSSSECSLLCDDMWRAGINRIVMDPWVRITYLPFTRSALHDELLGGLPMLRWGLMLNRQRQTLESLWSEVKPPVARDCCPMVPHSDIVDLATCYADKDWRARNHTFHGL